VVGAAVGAQCWLSNAAAFYLHRARAPAHVALEKRLAHLRDYPGRPDHHPAHRDELVDVLGIQVSHAGHLFHAKRTNLQTDPEL